MTELSKDEEALHEAAERGDTKEVDRLIKKGVDVKAADKDGYTALHIAAEKGNTGLVTALTDAGADVSIKNNDGNTALDIAKDKDKVGVMLERMTSMLAGTPFSSVVKLLKYVSKSNATMLREGLEANESHSRSMDAKDPKGGTELSNMSAAKEVATPARTADIAQTKDKVGVVFEKMTDILDRTPLFPIANLLKFMVSKGNNVVGKELEGNGSSPNSSVGINTSQKGTELSNRNDADRVESPAQTPRGNLPSRGPGQTLINKS
jgi:hypothetical protein